MNKFFILFLSAVLLSGCSSMNVRPTVGVSMGTSI
ncbi:lipoprotein [Acinetobacter pullicarnis]